MPALLLFRHGDTLTLSIINRRLHKRDPNKDVLEKVTLIKDIRIAHPHRAHIEILFDLSLPELYERYQFTNFVELHEAWQKTLDTSELNKRFFKEIANWYFWAQEHVTFPEGAGKNQEERNATSVIRLITRLVFVWFIREKGLVPDGLFDQKKIKATLNFNDAKDSTYYKAVLQNLFFATLNTEMNTAAQPNNRKFRGKTKQSGGRDQHYLIHNVYRYERYFQNPSEFIELCAPIPFLNGGLFECLDRPDKDDPEKIIRVDGFSDRPDNELSVPDELFFGDEREVDLNEVYGTTNKKYKVRGLINTLERYKFTIDENTPIEEEIALDPELLGKVFENLLAAYNPETGVTARKQTGSFYTPREIVNYMVDESLIAYFETKLATGDEGPLRATNDESSLSPQSSSLGTRLRHLLAYNTEPHQFTEAQVTKLIEAIDNLKVLDPACGSGAFPMGVLHKLVFILGKLDPGNQRWKEKQIAKASEIPDSTVREKVIEDIEQAFGRNELDYGRKLYLIENCIYGVDIQPIAVQIAKLRAFISLVVDEKIDNTKENRGIRPLPNLETKFVSANSLIGIDKPAQMTLRNPAIDQKEKELAEVRRNLFTARAAKTKEKYRNLDAKLRGEISELLKKDGFARQTTEKLARWDPYDQNTSADFFDAEWMFGITTGFDIVTGNPPYGIVFDLTLKARLETAYPTFVRNNDIYVAFYERGVRLLADDGTLAYISPNTFLNGDYFKPLRLFLTKKTIIREIRDYKETHIFEGQTVFVCVFICSNMQIAHYPYQFAIRIAKDEGKYFETTFRQIDSASDNELRASNSLIDKIFGGQNFATIEDLFLVKDVGFNYWSQGRGKRRGDGSIGDRVFYAGTRRHPKDIPFLKGRNIQRWIYSPPTNFLKHDYTSYLNEVVDTFRFSPEFFSQKPKIIYRQTANTIIAAIDESGMYLDKTVHLIVPRKNWNQYPAEYLLGLMNSKLFAYLYAFISQETEGRTFAQVKTTYIKKLPIPKAIDGKNIYPLVLRILAAKRADPSADTTDLEREIDQLVYQLYGLAPEEIAIVEGKR